MKKTILLCSLAGLLAAGGLMATQAIARGDGINASLHGGWLQRMANKLNLTADQRTQIKAILADEKATLPLVLSAVHDTRKGLREAIRAQDATEASVRAASAKVAAAEGDLAVERMKLYGKIAPILTDAQRQQLAGLQQRADDLVEHAIARIGSGLGD